MMPFPFPDNPDHDTDYDDPDPDEIERCRHGVAVDHEGSTRDCDACNEAAAESQSTFAEAEWPFASNH